MNSGKGRNLSQSKQWPMAKLRLNLGLLTPSLFYSLIRLKLRLVKYCTKVYANRRNHSYPSFPILRQETTPTCHTWAQLPRASFHPFHSRKEEPGRTLHLPPALATKKGLPHLSVHRMAVKARRNLEHLIPRVILKPKAVSLHFLKPVQDV